MGKRNALVRKAQVCADESEVIEAKARFAIKQVA
jgi:hypothetical protein